MLQIKSVTDLAQQLSKKSRKRISSEHHIIRVSVEIARKVSVFYNGRFHEEQYTSPFPLGKANTHNCNVIEEFRFTYIVPGFAMTTHTITTVYWAQHAHVLLRSIAVLILRCCLFLSIVSRIFQILSFFSNYNFNCNQQTSQI